MRGAVTQAGAIAAASALRYGRALAEIQTRYQAVLMRALLEQAPLEQGGADQRALADELRAWLREIGETANQEARRLQSELDRLSELVAQIIAVGTPAPPRQHRAKE